MKYLTMLRAYDPNQYDQHVWDYRFKDEVQEILARPIRDNAMWKVYYAYR